MIDFTYIGLLILLLINAKLYRENARLSEYKRKFFDLLYDFAELKQAVLDSQIKEIGPFTSESLIRQFEKRGFKITKKDELRNYVWLGREQL